MSDNPFDRRIINSREKPVSEDVNALQAQQDRALRFFAKSLFSSVAGSPQSGFCAGGFAAVESGPQAMSVVLKAGLGFQDDQIDVLGDINGINGLDDFESYKPLPLLVDLAIPIPAAPAGPNTRIDIIEVRADRFVTDNQARDVFNVTTEEFQSDLVDKTMEFLLDGTKFGSVNNPTPSVAPISLKVGTAANPGVAPAVTPGYVKVDIAVGSAVVVITNADITDQRNILKVAEPTLQDIFIPSSLGQASITFPGPTKDAYHEGRAFHSISPNNFDISLDLTPALKVGDRILSITAYCHDVAVPIDFDLIDTAHPALNGSIVSGGTDASDASGNEQSVPITGISFNGATNILESGHGYRVRCQELGTPSNTNRFYGVRVTYDHPQ